MARPPLKDKNSASGLVGLGNIPGLSPVASFNIDQINNLLDTKGFRAWHYRHCLNPIQETLSGPVDPSKQSGFEAVIYYSVREVKIVPQQFRVEEALTVQGIWGQGTTMFNVSGKYMDGNKENVHVSERDLIVFDSEMTDLVRQKFEFNPTGPQKLHYKALGVEFLRDSRGNVYTEGSDFVLSDGQIVWLKEGRMPDFKNGKGEILSIVYWYNPVYIVVSRPHSLRVLPSNKSGNGAIPRDKTYAPQLLIVRPSTLYKENDILGFSDLPPIPAYSDSNNTTGGST
jgi:hypothetical protein